MLRVCVGDLDMIQRSVSYFHYPSSQPFSFRVNIIQPLETIEKPGRECSSEPGNKTPVQVSDSDRTPFHPSVQGESLPSGQTRTRATYYSACPIAPMHPAVLLLLRLSSLLQLLRSAIAFAPNVSCPPARCGDLDIAYPFTLGGVQPPECGFPAFELACDAERAYLTRTFRERLYRVYNISYDINSLAVAVETTFSGDVSCGVPDFNMSSALALYPLNISNKNKNLVFVYNCLIPHEKQLSPRCGNHTIGAYVSEMQEGEGNQPQWVQDQNNCTSVIVPVRAFQENKEPTSDYMRLLREGFLLEWPARHSEDCNKCRKRGGECRFVQISFQCLCPDGRPCPTSRGNCKQLVSLGCSYF